MKTVRVGKSELSVNRLAYGCWRLADYTQGDAETIRARGKRAVLAAYEAGYSLFDLADIYCDGESETLFGQILRDVPEMRGRIALASKSGIRKMESASAPYRYDSSADYLIQSCEGSLRRLGVETIDLYQIHRPDYLGSPVEIAAAFQKLQMAGKARHFGISNATPSQLATLQRFCTMPLIVNQIEISLLRLNPLTDGTLDQCLAEQITPLAWSPLGGGRMARDTESALGQALRKVAVQRNCSATTVALNWLLKHPAGIVPLVGSTDVANIQEAVKAESFEMTREEWYSLLEAGLGQRLP